MNRSGYDAIVVGARAAGASTALLLARAGLRVLVVDRARYGSDTLSTHALMRGGVLQLSRWGLLDEVVAAGTPAVRRTVMRYGASDEIVAIEPRPGCEALYAPRRTVLDRILVDAAFRAGADVRFGASVIGLTRGADGRVDGVTVRAGAEPPAQIHAPLVIGADGVRSVVARAVDAPTTLRGRHASALVVGWYSGVEAEGYQWLYGHAADGTGRSGGILPTNDGQVCAWIGLPARAFPDRRPVQHLEQVMDAIAPEWAARLRAGRRDGPVRGFAGLPAYLRRPWGPGWALVGDAGSFKDPITAHGITDALRDAEILARAVVAAADRPDLASEAMAGYERIRDRLSIPLVEIADQVASYRWPMDELRALLIAMSAAMRDELAYLGQLDDPDPSPAPAPAPV